MVERGSGLGFLDEAPLALGIAHLRGGQKLEPHEPVQARVAGLVDHTHSSATQLLEDAVMRNGLRDWGGNALCQCLPGHFYGGTLQETSCLLLRGEQRPDLSLQLLVARTRLAQKKLAVPRRTLQRGLQQVIDLFPSIRIHLSFRSP